MRREAEVQSAAPVRVEEVTDRAAFAALEEEWNALVAQTDDQLFYRHEFIRVWLDNFAPDARLKILTLRGADGALQAVLPLLAQRASWYGLPVRELRCAANLHSCRFDLVARDPQVAARAFLDHLEADSGWDVLRLTDVPENGRAFVLSEAAEARGMPTGVWEANASPWLPLPSSWEELLVGLDAKFKANVRRRRRKLEQRGQVTFERVEGGLGLESALEEGLALERSGWKGAQGTAIAQDGATRGFYTELARTASGQGALALSFLRVDGKAVAFHYALEHGGRYLLLKPGYDEALGECSPGQLMMDEVLRTCIERGLAEFDFLGPDMVWKRDWASQVRPHSYLFIFRRSPLGRALREAKFRWLPAAKETLTRWKR
jgi:CelD/BcsL family acetyltransferase involved in cellulose biosynthesis